MNNMSKKSYKAPQVQKISLVVKNAVLGTCHSSPTNTPKTLATTCENVPSGCWYATGV